MYVGKSLIPVPDKVMKHKMQVEIGLVENYKGIDDENLILDSKKKVRDYMSKRFRTYFD
ncbi:hypothetical protein [Cloacibacterium sp. TD35]|uniref:hypothetical protein n=1 Tax=Cloacibacterium sp. TD35 TaxID=2976818 RepID=UPI00237EC18A|nr:hypothetical protein [Cloacibacterium sp. TD35]WDT67226.1 hypothetical protein N7277_07745 [Cloacibacterium sp. TD35]